MLTSKLKYMSEFYNKIYNLIRSKLYDPKDEVTINSITIELQSFLNELCFLCGKSPITLNSFIIDKNTCLAEIDNVLINSTAYDKLCIIYDIRKPNSIITNVNELAKKITNLML